MIEHKSVKVILVVLLGMGFLPFIKAQDRTPLKFADPLTDNMVVQQNKPFTVWGTANPNAEITITPDWTAPITVKSTETGNFKGIVPVPAIQEGDYKPHTLTLLSGTESKQLANILIGELWICSGQSNMQFSMKEVPNAEAEIAKATNSHIRLFNTKLNFSDTPIQNVTGNWMECTPQSVREFSAVGYYFGETLQKKLNVPVGLLFTGIGASAAQAYVPKEVLKAHPTLDSAYLEPYLRSEKSKEKIDGGFTFEKVTRPYLLYNALINPFTNLSIKGFCWYQGESNRNERGTYTRLMYAMIESWRTNFSQGNLPFYYVQVAPFFYDIEDPVRADYAFFREAQERISELGNTEMVVTMDVGESKDLHPKNKKPIGVRLANTALNRTYGFLDVRYQGPQFEYAEFNGHKAFVHFKPESVNTGLTTNDGKLPQHFQLSGSDQVFYPAGAKIVGNRIEVYSDKVRKPVAVRYAFTNYPVTNLENTDHIPALPFRSDDWKEPVWTTKK
ncbi:sialate O-acetylesterase [Spirosoma sp. HMF4905]|uniref:Sialate O-acetylesterase n=1 Tax=Spirosoma arboris TaxID=2682092 RepID=A0A7K1SMM3_9BACT|nr:sialate O-acetylesterase [Spirosoma arboris]MVM35042.1 sialate O-acetylesterase [Spirosoma arboris]